MLHPDTVANLAISAMLLACILGTAFMAWFLVALTRDARTMHAGHTIRFGRFHAVKAAPAEIPYLKAVVNSAPRLALGVSRISAVLASDAGRNNGPAVNRLHLVTLARPGQEHQPAAARRYRSG